MLAVVQAAEGRNSKQKPKTHQAKTLPCAGLPSGQATMQIGVQKGVRIGMQMDMQISMQRGAKARATINGPWQARASASPWRPQPRHALPLREKRSRAAPLPPPVCAVAKVPWALRPAAALAMVTALAVSLASRLAGLAAPRTSGAMYGAAAMRPGQAQCLRELLAQCPPSPAKCRPPHQPGQQLMRQRALA